MPDDRRAVLEAIAYGSDQRISPTDRLKALDQLQSLPVGDEATLQMASAVSTLTTEELEADLAGMLGGVVPSFAPAPAHEHIKRETTAFDQEVERRVSQRLRDHANTTRRDDDVIEGEVVDDEPKPIPLGLLAPPGIDPDDPSLDNSHRGGRRITPRGRPARI